MGESIDYRGAHSALGFSIIYGDTAYLYHVIHQIWMPGFVDSHRVKLKFRMDFSDTGEINSLALQTRYLHRFYGRGWNAVHVLRGLDMDVPYGTM